MNRRAIVIVLGFCISCAGDEPAPAAEANVAYLSPVEHLVRASMALRGIRPSLEEMSAVREDPEWLPSIIDYYLTTDAFGATIREMHAEQLLVGIDPAIYPAGFPARAELAGMEVQAINTSVVEAPVRLIEHVVMHDRPYHEIVTADYTVTDPIVSTVFGIPYDETGPQWQVSHYDDERPHAGVLSDSFLFTRHSSTLSNKSRGRANVIARSLLCYDFLSRQVEINTNIDLTNEEAVQNAITNNEACASCHQTLDPLASNFADFAPIYVPSEVMTYPVAVWDHPYERFLRVTSPGYFGEHAVNLRDLGILIGSDPRFGLCTARRFYSYLAQIEPQEAPLDIVADLYTEFVNTGMNAKAVARAIVLSDSFRVAQATSDEGADDVRGVMKVRPEQLARMIEDLTGYRWQTSLAVDFGIGQIGRVDLMTDSLFGFEVLAGGTDSMNVTQPALTHSATSVLVMRALAAHAAPYTVTFDFAESLMC